MVKPGPDGDIPDLISESEDSDEDYGYTSDSSSSSEETAVINLQNLRDQLAEVEEDPLIYTDDADMPSF
jgi:hypothetical protein